MKKRMSKKGAMELSINTIVIVVIGITLLVLGLVFVRGIFEKLGDLGGSAFQQAEQELGQIQVGDTKINFPSTIEIKKGDSVIEDLKICNTDGTMDANSQLVLTATDFDDDGMLTVLIDGVTVSGTDIIQTLTNIDVDHLKCMPYPVRIMVQPGFVSLPAEQPFLTITVQTSGDVYAKMGTIIKVTS